MTSESRKSIVVVHDSPLRGDCLTRTLSTELKLDVRGVRSIVDAEALSADRVDLILLDIGDRRLDEAVASESVAKARALVPDAFIAVIADTIDLQQVVDATRLKLKGLISSDEKLDVVVAAVRLIMAGGKYFSNATELTLTCDLQARRAEMSASCAAGLAGPETSGEAAGAIMPAPRVPDDDDRLFEGSRFTARETQILECLQQGFPNKTIATRLRLSENTVKVHLRHIMRKLSVKNRTEAALFYRAHPVIAVDKNRTLGSFPAGPRHVLFQLRKDIP